MFKHIQVRKAHYNKIHMRSTSVIWIKWRKKLRDLNKGTWLKIYVMEEVTLRTKKKQLDSTNGGGEGLFTENKESVWYFCWHTVHPPPQNSPDFPLKKQVHVLWIDLMLLVTCNLSLSSCFTVIPNDWFRNWFRYLSS